jgi:hypothetical protein
LRLADAIASLPLVIHVEGDASFNVTHGDLHLIGSRQDTLFSDETICVHKADIITSSRVNVGAALRTDLLVLPFGSQSVQISPTPLGGLPITYVGHSPMEHVTVHNSYVYIDQCVGARTSKRAADQVPPTVLDHRKFAYWLGGVATARSAAATASTLLSVGAGVSSESAAGV